jgi:hypothetical protein
MAKIIFFNTGHLQKENRNRLTPRMITTLLAACKKQNKGIPFGPNDVKGSFITLIARGLIINKGLTTNYPNDSSWQVTPEAMAILKLMGIEVVC